MLRPGPDRLYHRQMGLICDRKGTMGRRGVSSAAGIGLMLAGAASVLATPMWALACGAGVGAVSVPSAPPAHTTANAPDAGVVQTPAPVASTAPDDAAIKEARPHF